MRYLVLACDYDGTLATDGHVGKETLAALGAYGRRAGSYCSSQAESWMTFFPCSRIAISSTGSSPRTGRCFTSLLAAGRKCWVIGRPSSLSGPSGARGVQPLSAGRVIVATWQPHEAAVLQVIAELGLELQIIFNKGAVMVLPPGVNKATGLAAALQELNLSPQSVVGIGDAENDYAFLSLCGCAVAVANALPAVKQRATFVTRADHGAGVAEVIDELIASDLGRWEDRLIRHPKK